MKKFALMLGLLSLVGLSACGTNDSNVGGDVGGDGNKPTVDPVVNVYMPSPAGLQKSIEKGFEDANPGIDMVVTSGTTGELLAKIESEKANPVCDVLILASWSDGMSALTNPDLSLYAYEPENSDKIAASFKEDSHKIYGTSASAVGVIYNTDNVKLDDLKGKDWGDFASWDSKTHPMAIPDPTLSGAAKDFVAGIVSHFGEEEGWKIMNGWASDGLTNGGKNGPAMTSVVSGENDLIIGGVDYNVYEEKKKGSPVDIYYPTSGTVVNARPAMILSSSKHLENAKKVMDYLCSDEGQKNVADAYLLPGRTDVSADSSRSSLKDIPQLENLDWTDMAANGTDIATKLVNAIKNNK